MREILFRGQTRKKGEKVSLDGTPVDSNWVYGGVAQFNEERAIIYQTEPEFHKFAVYAETLGQFTGLTDKNGNKIFEGDIVESPHGTQGFIEWQNAECAFLVNIGDDWQTMDDCTYEVVGNIYDKGEEK